MADSGDVLEGFLCPICMTDLKTPQQLTKHFEDVHNEDPEILKSLKDLFGKAKQKILKQDESAEICIDVQRPVREQRRSPEINWGPQEIGPIGNHTAYFKAIRNARLERYSTETNKLLIRLDKLLNNLPIDPVDRKVHEKAIVPWIDDKDVRLCPTCAKSFGLTRRKHHCRLCGAVMCNDCSMFLSLFDARKMTSPVSQDDTAVSPTAPESQLSTKFVRAGIGITKFARSPSSGSLNSVFSIIHDPSGVDQNFRLCVHCKDLLDARERLKARHFMKPVMTRYYDEMRNSMEEATRFMAMYNKMWESISDGETIYDLRDAQILRMKIAKIGENVDSTSKRILALGTMDTENSSNGPRPQNPRLYHMIRTTAMIFLKEQVLTIPSLPSEEEYAEIVAKREARIQERIAFDKQLEMEESQREKRSEQKTNGRSSQSSSFAKNNESVMEKTEGWGPSNAKTLIPSSSMDPIIEQMSNLRSYIKQARADCKYDEVAMLENNLRELQSAYFVTKQDGSDG
ncbi:rabenosyn-5 [Venturia canescens]|uniref:rabenosyn-5 n=1 Tax=Venturia canescens TaxID=32260 RepID=UPI001C9C3707|nr:rabenosyn-5 [Venturia canescens]